MMRTAKKWIMVGLLASLFQVTITCDEQFWEDFLNGIDVQYHGDHHCDDDWDDCDGGWFDVYWW
jgi:hypothetical protein